MQCPDCKGKGSEFGHANTGPDSRDHYWGELTCLRCKGEGVVPDQMAEWMKVGAEMREERLARGETLMDAARRLQLRASELSAYERGMWPQDVPK